MRTLRPVVPLLPVALCLALAACGQKGPLYLPDATTRPQPPASAPATTPDPATSKKKDGDGTGVR